MKLPKFPLVVTEAGVSVRIKRVSKIKGNAKYVSFVVDYRLLAVRKQEWKKDFPTAKATAAEIFRRIANQSAESLALTSDDRAVYLRALEALGSSVPLDVAARDYAAATALLGGRATLADAAREWLRHHAIQLPRITVADAVAQTLERAKADGKSKARQHQLTVLLSKFAEGFNCEVHTITPQQVSAYLSGLPLSERSKKNHRDVVGFLNRQLVMNGYLAKGVDWLENVQNYSTKKLAEIEIYEPAEMATILAHAAANHAAMVPFLAIGAFAGLRHAELDRLEWKDVELGEKPGESFIHIKAEIAKTGLRRLVPVPDNLKAWLLKYRKESGPLVDYENTTKQLLKVVADAKVTFKRNGLRHSAISYRIAESGDVARCADESGNSPAVIRSNYLRRVKPSAAKEWFGICPVK